jgi:hypothetical protein
VIARAGSTSRWADRRRIMNEQEIVEQLSSTHRPRASLYLSAKKIEDLYSQTVTQITEIVRSAKISGKISASLFRLIEVEGSAESGLAGKFSISSMLQALLIETAESERGELVDLTTSSAAGGRLLKYTGPGSITLMNEPVLPNVVDLPPPLCNVISQERNRQERLLRFSNDNVRSIVLTFKNDRAIFASIASTEGVDLGTLASYGSPPFGFLGRLETSQTGIDFLSPLWIWRDGW